MTPRATRRNGGRRTATAVLAALALVGAALLVFALIHQVGAPPEPPLRTAGALSDGAGAQPSDGGGEQTEPADPQPSAASRTDADEPSDRPSSAPPEESVTEALPASAPSAVRIDAIGVQEQVVPLGLGEDGKLLAPRGAQADLVAWYDGSPTPGENGPSVLEGHVTWGGEPSVFFELGALQAGDRIEVDREDGTVATFEVYDAARYPKDEFPTVAVYGRTDGPELRLITCAGDLDQDGHHLDNTVVFARLVEG